MQFTIIGVLLSCNIYTNTKTTLTIDTIIHNKKYNMQNVINVIMKAVNNM